VYQSAFLKLDRRITSSLQRYRSPLAFREESATLRSLALSILLLMSALGGSIAFGPASALAACSKTATRTIKNGYNYGIESAWVLRC